VTGLTFYIVDVFAERRYAGNQLAVVRAAGGLSSDEMQQIAGEMHFSETTFIRSDEQTHDGFDVRIFTPKEEVPFAGHPTLGTAHIIRNEILRGKADTVVLNLKVGQIPISFAQDGYSWMKQMEPTFGRVHGPEILAEVLSLDIGEIDARYPIEEVSTGLPFFIVPMKTGAALRKARINAAREADLIAETTAKAILVFCPETRGPQNDIGVRVFSEKKPLTCAVSRAMRLAGHLY
jgi:trans-2,3-dihydro-3-hydroxyanthranilate isomerase